MIFWDVQFDLQYQCVNVIVYLEKSVIKPSLKDDMSWAV